MNSMAITERIGVSPYPIAMIITFIRRRMFHHILQKDIVEKTVEHMIKNVPAGLIYED